MGKIFYLLGKSASGKDRLYARLLQEDRLALKRLILYTTRPIRKNEEDGREYHFVTDEAFRRMEREGRVIEARRYETVAGPWVYFTADTVSPDTADYLGIGTLESYEKLKAFYGADRLVPIYVEALDEIRLQRSIRREMKQETPNLKEVCRRFLADSEDFSEEKLKKAGIERRFANNGEFADCLAEVGGYIFGML